MGTYLIGAGHSPPPNAHRYRAPEPAPDALIAGIRWGLAISLLGFWLPLGFLVSRGVQNA